MALPPWKLNLRPASFKGVGFHVEADTRSGGRRIVPHEFPKRDIPYAEDMGRRARRFHITGYLIGPNYQTQRDALVQAFETEGGADLVHPTYQVPGAVVADTYNMTERRERGGWVEFEVAFVEAGQGVDLQITADTQGAVAGAANNAVGAPGAGSAFDIAQQFMQTGLYGGVALVGAGFGAQVGFGASGVSLSASVSVPGLLASADFSGW
ncbi:DNA circularization N-terminal domain-containing protein [Bradyrhizobium sp. S3.7.6]